MSAPLAYFSSESLRARFVRDIAEALDASRISSHEGMRLYQLAEEPPRPTNDSPRLRVDRLTMEDGPAVCAELAAALLFSDSDDRDAPVFLSTLLFGVERFAHRSALLFALQSRFNEVNATSVIEAERIESPVFDAQTRMIMRQQASHLQRLWTQLHELPDLRQALGRALQIELNTSYSTSGINVFDCAVQIMDTRPGTLPAMTPVVGTQSLVDVAMDMFVHEPLPPGLTREFLDARGQTLSEAQASLLLQSVSAAISSIGSLYEQSLSTYWKGLRQGGRTLRDECADMLAESFRQHVLSVQASGVTSDDDYRRLRSLLPSCRAAFGSQSVRVRRLSAAVAGQDPVKLVGLFLIDFPTDTASAGYVYSSVSGFRRFEEMAQVSAHFASKQGRAELLFYSSLNDHASIREQGPVELREDQASADFFHEFIDSVIALQARNLRHVLAMAPVEHERASVRVDDALDIRALVDGRLLNLHDVGRWRPEAIVFDQVWGMAEHVPVRLPDSRSLPSDTWTGKLKRIESLLDRLDVLHAGVDGCLRYALNSYLALISGPRLDARALWVASDNEGEPAVRLLSLALDRASGHVTSALSTGSVLEGGQTAVSDPPVQRLPVTLLEQMLSCVLADFPQRFERQIVDFYTRPARHLDRHLRPGALACLVREYALRLEVFIEKRVGKVPDSVLQSVHQVLDRPLPAMRKALGEGQIDAFTLSVKYGTPASVVSLPNTFVMVGAHNAPPYIFWSLNRGLASFASLEALKEHVKAGLKGSGEAYGLPRLLAEPDRRALLEHRRQSAVFDPELILQRIDGHFVEALQRGEIERQRQTVADSYRRGVEWQLPSTLFKNMLGVMERDDRNRKALSNLSVAIQFIVSQAIVPVWMTTASLADQILLVNALQRFYVACVQQKDFLFGIPSLYEYSLDNLTRRLEADFPEQSIDPEKVVVTLTHYVPAPTAPGQVPQSIPAATGKRSENLVEYAVDRLSPGLEGTISVSTVHGQPLPAALNAGSIRNLAESLDVAAGYRRLLGSELVETAVTYPERRKLFFEQMPALDVMRALGLKLKGQLSETACLFIDAVLNMPDAIARLPVQGKKIVLSALQLLPASEGWDPTVVLNTYLIGPAQSQEGPWVLYALMHDEFVFKEYLDQTALLHDIRTSPSLQAMMLERIEPGLRKIYDRGGFMEPHVPFSVESSFDLPWERPQPVTLEIEPYEGNALHFLFQGAMQALTLQVRLQSVTNAEHRRDVAQYLLTLGAEQVMALVPGRLGVLVGFWQSQTLLNSSVVSASKQRWGRALSELMAALSVMISSRQYPQASPSAGNEESVLPWEEGITMEPAAADIDTEASDFSEFSWSNSSLTQQIRNRLRAFEVHDIALNTLHRDEMLNTYNDLMTGKRYAAIDGKAYELLSDENGWFIVCDDMSGPPVRLDVDQRWKLDIQGGLKGGGGVVTRLERRVVDSEVDDLVVVTARGMGDIRHDFPEMAQAIEEAHVQARFYLENCLANLSRQTPYDAVDVRAVKILGDFFGEKTPDARIHEVTRHAVTGIYEALMEPSLSTIDSSRYVVCVNKLGNEASSAFVFNEDPLKRVFLTEQFFRVPSYRLKLHAQRTSNFRFGAHYRASILIHELSHLALQTDDIAYVDAHAPFIDLLEDAPAYRLRLRNEQLYQQQKTLSYQTDRSELFKQLEDGTLRDLRRIDGNAKSTILRMTGKKTLDQARDVFYADSITRTNLMLKNADSVALLVTLLGRERFVNR
ncbi:dermonecrotic toxin domain-containing protein [Pseudomonas viridiflava]|uniref:Dermonecrotic toxin N-terminal domain-containing protein n=1 Tax=Pseudomonas viridiflava TaxID=33069 RepID=A0A3M5PIE9_PSEVI|nr:DUF6543 domain-containing protein [Pseudomonas viridiflava]RMT84329.1 hypothetical protein ALP40_02173 [Pseudomonas viridiflava]